MQLVFRHNCAYATYQSFYSDYIHDFDQLQNVIIVHSTIYQLPNLTFAPPGSLTTCLPARRTVLLERCQCPWFIPVDGLFKGLPKKCTWSMDRFAASLNTLVKFIDANWCLVYHVTVNISEFSHLRKVTPQIVSYQKNVRSKRCHQCTVYGQSIFL